MIFNRGILLSLCLSLSAAASELSFEHQIVDTAGPHDPWVKIVGDLNQDGRTDVIIAGQKGPLVWYAAPDWTKTVIADDAYNTVDGEVGDLDRDGDLDIVIGAEFWYENSGGEKAFVRKEWGPNRISDLRTHDVELGDLDEDGDLDIVARDQSGFGHQAGNKIHFFRQDDTDWWTHHVIDCPHGEGLNLSDIDRDGDLDVIAGSHWYENTKNIAEGSWAEHIITTDWHEDTSVKIGDINGDGRADAVLSRSEGPYKLSWFEAPEDPKQNGWTEHPVDAFVDFAHGIDLADMDNDGDLDIVTSEMHQSERDRVLVYLNNNQGTDWQTVTVAETGSHNLRVADFNGDGKMDIMGANWSGEYQPVEVWMGN